MRVFRLATVVPIVAAILLLLVWPSMAAAQRSTSAGRGAPDVPPLIRAIDVPSLASDGLSDPAVMGDLNGVPSHSQHGSAADHLPPVRENVELVSKLEMSTPAALRTPETADQPVLPGQIADLAVYKNFAYLNSWSEPTCRRGGIFVVDISNPAAPQQVGFLPAAPNTRHGEGAHVITIGSRDVLAVNNEPLPPPCDQALPSAGGIDLWDVTDPRNPVLLALGVGDSDPAGEGTGGVHHAHSVFLWNGHNGRAFAVMTDNDEFGTFDVDILEITNPAAPQLLAEHNLTALFDIEDQSAYGDVMYHHDVVVKKIDGVMTMLVSYWDAGYVTLDVDDPANPEYIGDSSFDGPDPLVMDPRTDPPRGWDPPEGNAHQAEFSHDNRFILAADEDFNTHRFITEIAGEELVFGVGVPVDGSGNVIPELLPTPGNPIEGDTRFVGDACTVASIPPPQAGETIAVAERGTCNFDLKAANASDAGYEAILIFNNVLGAAPRCEGLLNMTFTNPDADIIALFVPRSIGFRVIDAYDPATYRCVANDPTSTPSPAPNRAGVPVRFALLFDGWGYTHLYENEQGKLRHVDAFAIPEALDEQYWTGYGDLTVHEFAADPTENVAYSSYYAGGMRVFTFGPEGLTETGKFIDEGGNNFWGVEQFTLGNQRYFAGSDRDFGLYIFRYTGPGAAQRPVCRNVVVLLPFNGSATVPLPCRDANGDNLTRTIVSGPSAGTLSGDPNEGAVEYQHTGTTATPDRFTFKASDGSLESEPATALLIPLRPPAEPARSAPPSDRGRCGNAFVGTARRDTVMGSPFGDTIRGGAGNDLLDGLGGDDCLLGEGGRDQLQGNTGNDRLVGGRHRDRLFGGSGRDVLLGGRGSDHLLAASGHDRLNGGRGNDFVNGGSNNDRVSGGPGSDRLRGGEGRDRIFGNGGHDWLEAGHARNLLSGGGGDDRLLAANSRRDTIRCGVGLDRVSADPVDRVTDDCEVVLRMRQ
jgi:hypothetical protein